MAVVLLDLDDIQEERIDRKKLFLMQSPVFVYLDDNNLTHRQLICELKKDESKYNFMKSESEWLWPAFVLCEQESKEESQVLLQTLALTDLIAGLNVIRQELYSPREGVLVHFFGTDLYGRTETSNLKSFESVFLA